MKIVDIIKRSGRSLKQAKVRTALTSLAIAVGAFTLTLSLAAGEGARQYADNLIASNIDPRSVAVAADAAFFGEGQTSGPKQYDPDATTLNGVTFKQLTEDDLETIGSIDGVEQLVPVYQVDAQYVTREGQEKYAVDVQAYDPSIQFEVAAGSLPDGREQLADDEVVVPESYLGALGFEEATGAIDQTVTIHLERQPNITEEELQQVFMSGGSSAIEELTAPEERDVELTIRAVSLPSATALQASDAFRVSNNAGKELYEFLTAGTDNFQKYQLVGVQAAEGTSPESLKTALEAEGYTARTAQDLQELLFTIVNILQGIVVGFGVIALIASVFGIINTMYISVLERTQQIGLMKALGMRRADVLKLFLFEAGWIGLLGGIIGASAAIVLGTWLNPWITESLNLGDGNSLLIFQALPIAGLIVGLVLVGVISGVFPAFKAARLDPIEALRTE